MSALKFAIQKSSTFQKVQLRSTLQKRSLVSMVAPKYDIAVKGDPRNKVLGDCKSQFDQFQTSIALLLSHTLPPSFPIPPTTGPFCHRVLLTLEEKKVPYTMTFIDFADKPEWLVKLGGTVPVLKKLQDDDEYVPDSGAICQLLEQTYPEPPMGLLDSSPQVGLNILPAFKDFLKAEGVAENAEKEAALRAALQALEDHLTSTTRGPFIGGKQPCATDVAVMPRLYHAREALKGLKNGWEIPAAQYGAVLKYMEEFEKRDSWKKAYYAPEIVVKGWIQHLKK